MLGLICIILAFVYVLRGRKHDRTLRIQRQMRESVKKVVCGSGNHLFGLKRIKGASRLDLSEFRRILALNRDTVTVEAGVRIDELLDFLIPKGYILNVTPDMSHLTMGGIIAGVGGGSASFRHGYFHENVTQFDIIIGNGDILTCSPTQNSDLFYAVPNTLGTLGYILNLTFKIRQCSPYVETRIKQYTCAETFFSALETYQNDDKVDFLDGTIYRDDLFVLVAGYFRGELQGRLDNFVNDKVYWKAIQDDETHWFRTKDYIYRWDTDMYYTSAIIPQWMNWSSVRRCVPAWAIPWIKKALPYLGFDNDISDIVADILIPFENMRNFFRWYNEEVGLYPVYICPAKAGGKHTFWKKGLACDFGIGYGVESDDDIGNAKKIEKKMLELGGNKMLYSKTRVSEDEFWSIYDKKAYSVLRDKYHSKFPDLFSKVKA